MSRFVDESGDGLDVARLHYLSLRRHDHRRIQVQAGAGVRGRDLLRGDYRGGLPLSGVVKQPGPIGDLIGTFWATVYVVTQRIPESLRRLGASGWDVLPLRVSSRGDLSNLGLLTVTGRSGPIREIGIGRNLDPGEWDGSDVFLPADSAAILVVGEVADPLAEEHLVDLELEPAGLEPREL